MTWRQLDERTGNMLEDMDCYSYNDLVNEGRLDDDIFDCIFVDMVVETLEDFEYQADGWGRIGEDHAEYLENQLLLKDIKEAIR